MDIIPVLSGGEGFRFDVCKYYNWQKFNGNLVNIETKGWYSERLTRASQTCECSNSKRRLHSASPAKVARIGTNKLAISTFLFSCNAVLQRTTGYWGRSRRRSILTLILCKLSPQLVFSQLLQYGFAAAATTNYSQWRTVERGSE